jgi:hypothetical protein
VTVCLQTTFDDCNTFSDVERICGFHDWGEGHSEIIVQEHVEWQSNPSHSISFAFSMMGIGLREQDTMSRIVEKLGPRFRDEIQDAVEASMSADLHRVARHRFNRNVAATERNAFTKELLQHLSWLGGKEGRRHSTVVNDSPITILSAVIQMTLLHGYEKGFSPLQIIEIALRTTASILSSPPEFRMVTDLIGSILDEAGQQIEAKMTCVAHAEASDRKMKAAVKYLKLVEGEYRKGGIYRGDSKISWVHFERPEEAGVYRQLLIENGVEVFDGYTPADRRGDTDVSHDFSPLKLSVMRAIWEHSPYGGVDFGEVLDGVIKGDRFHAISRIGIQADAVLDALAKPNDDMVLGGCLEADPVGALIDYDPAQCTTQADVVAVYQAMIKEGRDRENSSRKLKKAVG